MAAEEKKCWHCNKVAKPTLVLIHPLGEPRNANFCSVPCYNAWMHNGDNALAEENMMLKRELELMHAVLFRIKRSGGESFETVRQYVLAELVKSQKRMKGK